MLVSVSLFTRRNVDGESAQVDFAQVPGFAHKPRPLPFRRKFLNYDQWRYICAAVVPQYQSSAVDGELREEGYLQLSKFHIAIEAVAKHGDGATTYNGIDVMSQ